MLKALVWTVAMLTATAAAADTFAKPPPATKPAMPKVTVVMTAVTLADDCNGAAPWGAPAPLPPASAPTPAPANVITAKADKAEAADDYEAPASRSKAAKAKRRCEQTSMQISVVAAAKSVAGKLKVTKVELFDDAGTSLGVLTASNPRVWTAAKSMYETWNESVSAGQSLSVSYALSQPQWTSVNRYNKTYTLKATVSVGGVSQTVSKDLKISAPAVLPPGVKT